MTLTSTVDSIIGKVNTATSHIASSSNPHSVTKAQVGLSNVIIQAMLISQYQVQHKLL